MKFRFVTLDTNGMEQSGQIDAASEEAAREILASSGDLIVSLRLEDAPSVWKFERRSQVTFGLAANFASDLSGLLLAGATLRSALELLAAQSGRPGWLGRRVLRIVEDGEPLSQALRQVGGEARTLAEFARAGEAGAGLGELLADGAGFLKSRSDAIAKIQNALAYPLFVLMLSAAAIALIIVYVAPALAPSLSDSQEGQFILLLARVGESIQEHGLEVVLAVAAFLVSLLIFARLDRFRQLFAQIVWHAPLIGKIIQDLETGQSASVIGALLKAGVSLEIALGFGARVSGPVLAQHYYCVAERLRDGSPAAIAFSEERGLPEDLSRLARLGEASSALSQALSQAGLICQSRALRTIERLSAVVGPFLVIGIGGMVAALMLTILSGLTSIGEGMV